MGWLCTFLQSGTSSACSLTANRLKTGISAMVTKMERRRVERRIILTAITNYELNKALRKRSPVVTNSFKAVWMSLIPTFTRRAFID
jgi:hypothetical protein